MPKHKVISDKEEPVNDGDAIRITSHHGAIVHKCCDCGLHHRITIDRDGKDLIFKFYRIDDFNINNYFIENIIEKSNKRIKP